MTPRLMTTVTISLLACLPVALAHGPTPHHDETARTPAVAGWWKGNTHTHTWWSDGDSPPESVGTTSSFWYPVNNDTKKTALKSYIEKFGADWVESRERDGVNLDHADQSVVLLHLRLERQAVVVLLPV